MEKEITEKTFAEKCYKILKSVPQGKVVTYKSLAKAMGTKAYRAVGTAMGKNPYSFPAGGDVPCHRVIKSNGEVGQFGFGIEKKVQLLKEEGVEIQDGKINLEKFEFKF